MKFPPPKLRLFSDFGSPELGAGSGFVTKSEDEPTALANAYGWVARMTTVILEMVLPGLGGQWLDSRWGTNFLVVIGFGLGFAVGLFHLLQMVKHEGPKHSPDNEQESDTD